MQLSSLSLILVALLSVNPVYGKQCDDQRVGFQVLGSGGPELDDGRASSGYLLWLDGKARVMIDAGPGTNVVFGQSGANFADLQGVLFSHFHVDHSGDFASYIKGSYFTDRQADLAVYGPDKGWKIPSASMFVQRLLSEQGTFAYLHDYVDGNKTGDYQLIAHDVGLDRGKVSQYFLSKDIKATAIPVHHGPVPAVAWKVEVAGCSVVLSGDMSNEYGVLADFAKGADLLVMHNAVPENAGAIAKRLHMTPSEIGQIGENAKAKKLVLSHFMNRTSDTDKTIAEIRRYYQGPLALAQDGQFYPFVTVAKGN